MERPLLEIRDFKAQFITENGAIRAVDGVDLTIDAGEIIGIVGESGSGKSVMCQSIMRLFEPNDAIEYEGEIRFEGKDVFALSSKALRAMRKQQISIIFQDPLTSLNPVFTIENQLNEVHVRQNKLSRFQARQKNLELLELTGIPDPLRRLKQYPHELSGGMQQRIMIAIALASEPKLLIADEPTTALDVTIQAQILDLIVELNKQLGMAVILISHDLAVVSQVCDRVAVMRGGKIVESAPTVDLFTNPQHPYTKKLIQLMPRLKGRRRDYFK